MVVCREKLSHPLHTYRIAGQCLRCRREREERLARFEIGNIRDGVERESFLGAVSRQRRKNETLQLKEKITSPSLRHRFATKRWRRTREADTLSMNGPRH